MYFKDLPEGWIAGKLGELVRVSSGIGFPKKFQGKSTGDYPVYKVGDVSKAVTINTGYLDTAGHYVDREEAAELKGEIFPIGTTLFAKIGEAVKLNRRAFVLKPGLADNNVMAALPNVKESSRFIYSFLRTVDLGDISRSTTVPSVRKGDIEEIVVSIPPLAEQKVIADKLDTLLAQVDTTKARLERIPQILKTFRQSILAAAVSGRLTEEWREDRKPTPPCFNTISKRKERLINAKIIKKDLVAEETTPPFNHVKGWLYLKLQSLALKITDGEHKTPKREDSGRYLISARNIQDGFITVANVDYVGEGEYQKLRKRCDPNKGDILISCSGSVGRVCLVDEDDMYVMVRSAALVRTIKEFVNENYLMFFLQSPTSQKNIEESSKSTAQSNLFLGPIKELEVALPTLEEQTEIVRRVEELFAFADAIEQKAAAALERVNKLTQSILAKAFRGELTADWRAANPELIRGENSAEALLKKIQAEREVLASQKQTKKKTRATATKQA